MVVVQEVVIKTPNNKIFYWEMINLTPITTIDIRPPPPTNRLGLEIFGYNDNVWCLGRTSSIRRYDTLKEEIRHNHLHEVHYFFCFLYHVGCLLPIINCIVIHLKWLWKCKFYFVNHKKIWIKAQILKISNLYFRHQYFVVLVLIPKLLI